MTNNLHTRVTSPIARTMIAAASVAAFSITTVTLTATSVEAAAPTGCVTKAEYKKVKTGMSQKKVHKIFGTKGIRVSNSQGVEGRAYQVCNSKRGGIGVVYGDGKVVSKAAQWR